MKRLLTRAFSVVLTPQILLMLAKIYLPVLFPITVLIALLSIELDDILGMKGRFIGSPLCWWIAAASFILGAAIWLIAYAAIVFEGKGSPSPTAGRTQELVTTGIYGLCRYPSVHGKFWGVLAVGLALDSFSFCVIVAPLLLIGSLIEKWIRQEPKNEAIFGDSWRQYRHRVPFFIPWRILGPRS